jgi:hypothetical protein
MLSIDVLGRVSRIIKTKGESTLLISINLGPEIEERSKRFENAFAVLFGRCDPLF